jgi:hypothetical protein
MFDEKDLKHLHNKPVKHDELIEELEHVQCIAKKMSTKELLDYGIYKKWFVPVSKDKYIVFLR